MLGLRKNIFDRGTKHILERHGMPHRLWMPRDSRMERGLRMERMKITGNLRVKTKGHELAEDNINYSKIILIIIPSY